jgi:hypothetical protein
MTLLGNLITRHEQGRVRFIEVLRERGGLTHAEAEKVLATYKRLRVVSLRGGEIHVKHGGFLDRATIRRALRSS